MKVLALLIISVFASEEKQNAARDSVPNGLESSAQNEILVKIEEDEYTKTKNPSYIGVNYFKGVCKWRAYRISKNGKKQIWNGSYNDEETAAHASDTLARELITNGENGHKLNFPDNETEVYPDQKNNFIGVTYDKSKAKWCASRRSKNENKSVYNGIYKDEETAAHASDTLARKLMSNAEKGHKLNFPDDDTDVYPEEVKFSSNYIGVSYNKHRAKWGVSRRSKKENKIISNGYHKDEETAAHASDTLARKLIANGEKDHKLNFPDEDTEVYPEEAMYPKKKRKRPNDLGNSENSKSHQNSKK